MFTNYYTQDIPKKPTRQNYLTELSTPFLNKTNAANNNLKHTVNQNIKNPDNIIFLYKVIGGIYFVYLIVSTLNLPRAQISLTSLNFVWFQVKPLILKIFKKVFENPFFIQIFIQYNYL